MNSPKTLKVVAFLIISILDDFLGDFLTNYKVSSKISTHPRIKQQKGDFYDSLEYLKNSSLYITLLTFLILINLDFWLGVGRGVDHLVNKVYTLK